MSQVTSYIAADPKAMAFINGKPEHDGPYTMRVNPAYKDIQLPVDSWPQLDTWQFKTAPQLVPARPRATPCRRTCRWSPTRSRACSWSPRRCSTTGPTSRPAAPAPGTTQDPYQLGRVAPQGVGNRFLLGLVTLGDAQRYGLTTAQLQAAPGHYVAAGTARDQGGAGSAPSPRRACTRSPSTRPSIRTSTACLPGRHGRLHRSQDLRAAARDRTATSPSSSGSPRPRASDPGGATASSPPATCRSATPG